MKIRIAALAATLGTTALLSAPLAAAEFDRAAYLRCMVSDAMSVGGLSLDSSSAAKLGAEAYASVGGQPESSQEAEITALAKKHQLSEPVATLIVQCAHKSGS